MIKYFGNALGICHGLGYIPQWRTLYNGRNDIKDKVNGTSYLLPTTISIPMSSINRTFLSTHMYYTVLKVDSNQGNGIKDGIF